MIKNPNVIIQWKFPRADTIRCRLLALAAYELRKRGFENTAVMRAARFRKCPLWELQLYTLTLSLKNVPLSGGVSSYRPLWGVSPPPVLRDPL